MKTDHLTSKDARGMEIHNNNISFGQPIATSHDLTSKGS